MPMPLLTVIRRRASHIATGSVFYNWSLRGPAPERLLIRPVDAWAGDAEAGHNFGLSSWMPEDADEAFITRTHGFGWLRDLRAAAADRGAGPGMRARARALVYNWITHYPRWDEAAWRPDITGERVAMWLSSYEFFGEELFDDPDEEQAFQDAFFDSISRQARHLSRALGRSSSRKFDGMPCAGSFRAAKGLLYAGLAFEGQELWIEQALATISQEIDRQILGDGAHRSRSPKILAEVLQIMLDVRMALRSGDYPLPEKFQLVIDRMGPALRFFRYTDKHLALFNGAQEGDVDFLDALAGQAGVRAKTVYSLPCAGYEKISQGRTTILLDCGPVPSFPFDEEAHAAPLAFEMTYGRERVFVNCGSHPDCPDWQDALRSTAAHTALTLANRNACEIRKDGHFARKVRKPSHLREEGREAVLLEASHDGYEPLNGFVHRRRIYLCEDGEDLRGEDDLSAALAPDKPVDFAVRFHLHPKAMVSLIRDGQEALIRLASGTGWRFHQAGGFLNLEESIYLGQGGQARKTKQLAIFGQVTDKKHKIKWALQREG